MGEDVDDSVGMSTDPCRRARLIIGSGGFRAIHIGRVCAIAGDENDGPRQQEASREWKKIDHGPSILVVLGHVESIGYAYDTTI